MRLNQVSRDFAPDYLIDPDLVDEPEDDPLWDDLSWEEEPWDA